jgi:glycosyltransferase involved in cell wall biosynthesis
MKVSVIIPTHNSSATLPCLLFSVREQTHTPIETIVVDNHSIDGTKDIAKKFDARVLSGGPERSAQRNLGARNSTGDLFLFLDADMEMTPRVAEACVDGINLGADALCLLEHSIGNGYWNKARALERSQYFGSEIFEAARCFRRYTFEELGGYDSAMTGVEDLDIQARLNEAGYRLGWVKTPILHHEEKLGLREYLKKRSYYSRTDRLYASRHPSRWRRQRSIRERWLQLSRSGWSLEALGLLPGLAIVRGVEWLLRS